jgi:hypothetical protein
MRFSAILCHIGIGQESVLDNRHLLALAHKAEMLKECLSSENDIGAKPRVILLPGL